MRVVALTGRHLADDHVWFSLFHEFGHLVMHNEVGDFLEDFDGEADETAVEQQANEFARDALIPGGVAELAGRRVSGPTLRQVVSFAAAVGVAPGIVVGRLHHDGILQYNQLRKLIRKYRWDGAMLRI
jgi:Zn-dependent peptidase ImmA (M78 family)